MKTTEFKKLEAGQRMSKPEKLERLNAYCTYRQMGKTQQIAGQLVGIAEKTAGHFERLRMKRFRDTTEIIEVLKTKAKAKDTPAKDLVLLSKEIDRLSDKLQKNSSLF